MKSDCCWAGGERVSECVYEHSPSEATILIKLTGPIILHISCSGRLDIRNRRPLTYEGHSNAQFNLEHLLSQWSGEALHRPVRYCMRSTTHTDKEQFEKHYREWWGTVSKTLQGPDEELYEEYCIGTDEKLSGEHCLRSTSGTDEKIDVKHEELY
jgi:hypothetical protein